MIRKLLFPVFLITSLNASAGLIFSDDFSSGNLSKTGNGFAWKDSVRTSVVSGQLDFPWVANTHDTEQAFTLGTTQYPDIWIKYDLTVGSSYCQGAGNNKGFIMLWSNTGESVSSGDGYSAPNEMLISIELNQNATPNCGSAMALRTQSLDAAGNPIIDYNASNPSLFPNAIAPSDIGGKPFTIIMHFKAGTFSGGSSYYSGGDGVCQVWKNGTPIMNNTTCNYYKPGWAGVNRGYVFGWRNGMNTVNDDIKISSFQISTTDVWGVSNAPNPPTIVSVQKTTP